jgi:hypothetical protein
MAYHNNFLDQARSAFVMGAYYPALVGACALGERILNHLVIALRDSFKSSRHYKEIYRKGSFDNWSKMIEPLRDWGVLLPKVALDYESLAQKRNDAVHFRKELDEDARSPALDAIHLLQNIIAAQFSALGDSPWFIPGTSGASFLRRGMEEDHFVALIFIPNSFLVSNSHQVHFTSDGILVTDEHSPSARELTDEEFARGDL